MINSERMIFIGGYAKSGTTFVGRVFDILSGVEAFGELDYFRVCYPLVQNMCIEFTRNIRLVNHEVYDDNGKIPPMSVPQVHDLHRQTFWNLINGGKNLEPSIKWVVEKSPRNVQHISKIKKLFPKSHVIVVYRNPDEVFRSFMRHMSDHRDKGYADANCKKREASLKGFILHWNKLQQHIEKNRNRILLLNYHNVSSDVSGFLDFAMANIFKQKMSFSKPIDSLTKEAYLATLPEKKRNKSLVQLGPYKIKLSDKELSCIEAKCYQPDLAFDF